MLDPGQAVASERGRGLGDKATKEQSRAACVVTLAVLCTSRSRQLGVRVTEGLRDADPKFYSSLPDANLKVELAARIVQVGRAYVRRNEDLLEPPFTFAKVRK